MHSSIDCFWRGWTMKHFAEVIKKADVSGALAASVFHKELIGITQLKKYLIKQDIEVRI